MLNHSFCLHLLDSRGLSNSHVVSSGLPASFLVKPTLQKHEWFKVLSLKFPFAHQIFIQRILVTTGSFRILPSDYLTLIFKICFPAMTLTTGPSSHSLRIWKVQSWHTWKILFERQEVGFTFICQVRFSRGFRDCSESSCSTVQLIMTLIYVIQQQQEKGQNPEGEQQATIYLR